MARKKWMVAGTLLVVLGIGIFGSMAGNRYLEERQAEKERQAIVSPELVNAGRSISKNESLEFDPRAMVFSNSPEFAHNPGILLRVDNAVSDNGKLRVLYSHLNLLTNPAKPEENVPAQVGFVMANHTDRTIDVMWERKSSVHNRDVNGKDLIEPNLTPVNPETGQQTDFGGKLGVELVKNWMKSGNGNRTKLLKTLAPNEKHFISETVGRRSWGQGMFDLVLVDHETKKPIVRNELKPNEGVQVEIFMAHQKEDLEQFYAKSQTNEAILPGDDVVIKAGFHHRGFFLPGIYPNAPKGEGITRLKTITYDPTVDGPVHVQLANLFGSQFQNPQQPFYNPNIYLNDTIKNGVDEYGVKMENGEKVVGKMTGQNNGEYGADYNFTFHLKGPTRIAIQAAGWNYPQDKRAAIDLYDQFFVYQWDGKGAETVDIKDPNFQEYYRNPSKLSPPGITKVIKTVDPAKDGETHTLQITLIPNGYGPFRIYLLPAN